VGSTIITDKGTEHRFGGGFLAAGFGNDTRSVIGLKSNLSYPGSDWQKKPFLDLAVSNLVAKRANLVTCFLKIVKICVFLAKYLIIGI